MKALAPTTKCSVWRSEHLFNMDFAYYTLTHHSFSRHFHEYYVIELVLNGADSFYCDGKDYLAETDQLVLINPSEVHTGNTFLDVPLHYFSLNPPKETLQSIAASLSITLSNDFCFEQSLIKNPYLSQKLKVLLKSFHNGSHDLLQQEIFYDCMHELLSPIENKTTESKFLNEKDKRIELVVEYLRSHYKEDISLEKLAGMVCIDPCYFIRLFKKQIGVSPYDYLLILRTESAKQLLREGYKVQDAALESGFYDASHLNRMFLKIAAASPKQFRLSKSQHRTSFTVL